jgi:hypothetical protein
MAKLYEELNDRLRQFIENQKMFFVGSAPLAADGFVNISPKGMDSLRVLSPSTVAYLDFTGSGIETTSQRAKGTALRLLRFVRSSSRPR